MKKKTEQELQPISDLFSNAWDIYKKTYLSYLKIIGLGIVLVVVGALFLVLIAMPLFFSAGGSVDKLFTNTSGIQFFEIFLVFFFGLLYLILLILYAMLMPIAYLHILSAPKKLSLKQLFFKSKPYLWAYFLTSLLTMFLVLGGMTLLFVPGFIISLFFSFVTAVVVLENLKGRAALARSYQLVSAYFWKIFLRVIAIQGGVFIVTSILSQLSKDLEIFKLISQIFSILVEWFGVIYMFTLYKEVKKKAILKEKVSLSWIWVVAIVGWLIICGVIAAFASGALHMPSSDYMAA